jgi:hypothetical protein
MRTNHDATVSRERSAVCCCLRTGEEPSGVSLATRQCEADGKTGQHDPPGSWGQDPVSKGRDGSSRELLEPSHPTQATDCLNPIQVRYLAALRPDEQNCQALRVYAH